MNGILDGKTILIAGVLTDSSIAFAAAKTAQEQGATVILTGHGRCKKITEATARRLPELAPVLEFDAEEPKHVDSLEAQIRDHTDHLDGIVHCISASYPTVVGNHFPTAPWDDVQHSFQVSAYSYQALAHACDALLVDKASIVGCTLDASAAWPLYGWAGVAKAAYESVNQYLAYHYGNRGIRSNLVAAGPLINPTMLAIPGAIEVAAHWSERAPLGWDAHDPTAVGRTITTLLSDWLPATTGAVVPADGGAHALGC